MKAKIKPAMKTPPFAKKGFPSGGTKMPQNVPGNNPQADDHDAMMEQRIKGLKAGMQRPAC